MCWVRNDSKDRYPALVEKQGYYIHILPYTGLSKFSTAITASGLTSVTVHDTLLVHIRHFRPNLLLSRCDVKLFFPSIRY
jgi:hypothetical protein